MYDKIIINKYINVIKGNKTLTVLTFNVKIRMRKIISKIII